MVYKEKAVFGTSSQKNSIRQMPNYVPNSVPWVDWILGTMRVTGGWKENIPSRKPGEQRTWRHRGREKRHKERERVLAKMGLLSEILLHWLLCRKPVIPIPLKRLGQ